MKGSVISWRLLPYFVMDARSSRGAGIESCCWVASLCIAASSTISGIECRVRNHLRCRQNVRSVPRPSWLCFVGLSLGNFIWVRGILSLFFGWVSWPIRLPAGWFSSRPPVGWPPLSSRALEAHWARRVSWFSSAFGSRWASVASLSPAHYCPWTAFPVLQGQGRTALKDLRRRGPYRS